MRDATLSQARVARVLLIGGKVERCSWRADKLDGCGTMVKALGVEDVILLTYGSTKTAMQVGIVSDRL